MTAINSNRAIRGPVTAVPVVAGTGINLVADTENNRWVAEVSSDYIVTTLETIGTYSVGPNTVSVEKTISKVGYKPIAWRHKFGFAAMMLFNDENTEITSNNALHFQGYIKNVVDQQTLSLTFMLYITWVKVS